MSIVLSLLTSSLLVAELSSAPVAEPAESEAEASGSITAGVDGSARTTKAKPSKKRGNRAKAEDAATSQESKAAQEPWIRRWPPQRNMVELGVMGGLYLPGKRHELFEATLDLPEQGFRRFATLGPEIGARVSYLPLRVLGIELEGAVMPTRTDNDLGATLWTVRGGLIGQLPYWSATPFLVVGSGLLAVSSEREAVGNDIDPTLYVGGGFKLPLTRMLQLRLDLRDVVSHKRSLDDTFQNHNFEALLSLTLTLNRPKPAPPPPPPDSDGDGFLDSEDQCVDEPGVAPDGCPIRDSDGDGFLDPEDQCIDEPGVVPDGCPIRDADGDGFLDPEDQCVDEAGVEPDGCPIRDTDEDGIMDPDDDCKEQPETPNGYEDADGCPDEVPEEVQRFTGVIKGIRFDTGKATIRPSSRTVLDGSVEVLVKYTSIQVEISGHTDDRGNRGRNVELSLLRANAVRDYLIDKGVDASRIRTRGAGPDEPIDTNKTKAGRASNRRIEFKILQQ